MINQSIEILPAIISKVTLKHSRLQSNKKTDTYLKDTELQVHLDMEQGKS